MAGTAKTTIAEQSKKLDDLLKTRLGASTRGGKSREVVEQPIFQILVNAKYRAGLDNADAKLWASAYTDWYGRVSRNADFAQLLNQLRAPAASPKKGVKRGKPDKDVVIAPAGGAPLFGDLPVPDVGPANADRSTTALLGLLNLAFSAGKKFEETDQLTVALYELIWKLPLRERRLFLGAYHTNMHPEAARDPRITDTDLGTIGAWIAELFLRTNGISDAPSSVTMELRCLNPTILSPHGQSLLMIFIDRLFASSAKHSGGAISPMVLHRPNMDVIKAMNDAILQEYNKPSVVEEQGDSGSAPMEETESGGDAYKSNDSGQESDDTPVAVPVVSLGGKQLGLVDESSNYDPKFALPRSTITAAIYQGRLRAQFDNWFNNATTVPGTVKESSKKDESERVQKIHTDRTEFKNQLDALKSQIDSQRKNRRLIMTDAAYDRLTAELQSIDARFVGMYSGRSDLIRYLIAQLTGPRPRDESSNHMTVRGEPGTGKTSLCKHLRKIMDAIGLVEPATLDAFETVGSAFSGSMSEGMAEDIRETTVIPKINSATLRAQIGETAYTAMQAARYVRSQQDSDITFRPADFESTYRGGGTRQFALAVMKTLGSVMIIDEAYSLSSPDLAPVVDLLTEYVTRFKLQWGSMLLGYEDRIDALLLGSNEGLDRRYHTKFTLQPYTTLEMAAIIIKQIINSDTVLLAESMEAVQNIVNAEEWAATVNDKFDAVWAAVAPYTLRPKTGDHDPDNIFGVSNGGGAGHAFVEISVDRETKKSADGLLRFVTDKDITRVFSRRRSENKPFGKWPKVVDKASSKKDSVN